MSVNFITSGQKTFVEKLPDGVRTIELKAKLYTLECSREEGFFLLEVADKYTLPKKTYGNYAKAAERVINTHYKKNGNTGILSTGLKGTGKSLFTKFIANGMIDRGVPVIQINKPYPGEEIFNFIENIGSCVLVFDEFCKHYKTYDTPGGSSQLGLLSLLDGLGNSKRMHLFTENDSGAISEYLLNRPGRVHYHFKYARLSDEVIKEFCEDLNIPGEITSELLELSVKLKVLSFDIVSCLINEWKMYGGKLTDHLDILNITLCKDPSREDIELISFVREDGTQLTKKDVKIDYRDNYINLSLNYTVNNVPKYEYLDAMRVEDAASVKDDIYTFITKTGDTIVMKIRAVRY